MSSEEMVIETAPRFKKNILIAFMLLCLLYLSALKDLKMSVRASPATWTVDKDGTADFKSIQEAINTASSGDTIFVCNGIYYEHVVINKTITLVGESRDFTIIDGNNTGTTIIIKSHNVTVRDLTIKRGNEFPAGSIFTSGIFIDRSMNNDITNNKIIDNSKGISLYSSNNNLIYANIILNNDDGISLYSSSNNMILDNVVNSNMYFGIILYYSGSNVISGNAIFSNKDGIGLSFSSNNTIYHNNFNNTNQVWSDSTNVWSYGGEGNYWIDYAGQDLNKDGIGDSFYTIDALNRDDYPLMGMFSDFSVNLKETYSVTVISNSTISDFRFEIGAETGNKILCFNVVGKKGIEVFCRVKIPIELMKYPYEVLVDAESIVPRLLDVSNETHACLYLSFFDQNRTVRILYSETFHLYLKLQTDFYDLNRTYYSLLENHTSLLGNYTRLQSDFYEMNNSFSEHHADYSKRLQNIQSLTQILAVTTAVFIATTVYLSKRAHAKASIKTDITEE